MTVPIEIVSGSPSSEEARHGMESTSPALPRQHSQSKAMRCVTPLTVVGYTFKMGLRVDRQTEKMLKERTKT